MALCWCCPSPFSLLQSPKSSSFKVPCSPKSLIPTTIFPYNSLSLSFHSISKTLNPCFSSLVSICCSTSSESSTASDHTHSTSVFIKGLPQSTSEGRLKKAFSQLGEVNEVKINTDKFSGQSLGSAYVGFAREEYAHLAVKEMNGKFFDGRFILVRIAKPKSSSISQIRTRHYKF
ncbi:hypothetical protein FEM48_Zijuj07G0133400 [Ziziphus jujuba var. spinosa]|uniref:RRM domain-containing protein n=1 Tax=Ziziphus jujuba var. spinosa TaxID=714518 RepID=A0A978V4V9_ZIZJJ|nr:organelle RRM domain-containing protein 2, mitochondrial-like isoform X1 [Ziziphus jujuba var. spinosa]KAH7522392.1 hypothetical protein FEM48_Zijuj07G0133400 [Ziziphus jujuba var. spinosa]